MKKMSCAVAGISVVIGMMSAQAAPRPTRVFDSQWAWKNTGQNICNNWGKACQVGSSGHDVKALQAWQTHKDCSNILVAVLDTGMDYNHVDLKGSYAGGKNVVSNSDDPMDDNLHGTHVAGTIAATGSQQKGAAGVCNSAKVLVVKVASPEGSLSDSDIISGIDYASQQGAKVVNASFGGEGGSALIEAAIKRASNTLFVIAAGNGDPFTGVGFSIDERPVYPAAYKQPNIIAVAATDNQDKLGSFSNYGVNTVHIAAPGVNIMSTSPSAPTDEMKQYKIPGQYAFLDGTSMATPHVTGAAAFLWSYHPEYSLAQVKQKLLSSAEPVPALAGKVSTGGRLNLASLLK